MADLAPGILSVYFGEAVLLTILASSLLLLIYRRAVASTMRAAVGPSATEALAAAPIRRVAGTASRRSPAQMERRAQFRLAVVYILAGGLAAAVLAGLFLISLGDETRGLQTFVVWYVYAWPVPLLLPTLLALPRRAALVAFGSYTLWGAVVVAAWSIGSLALGQARNPPSQNVLSYLTFLGM